MVLCASVMWVPCFVPCRSGVLRTRNEAASCTGTHIVVGAKARKWSRTTLQCIVRAEDVLEPAGPMVSTVFSTEKEHEFTRERVIMAANESKLRSTIQKGLDPSQISKEELLEFAQAYEDSAAASRTLLAKASFIGDFVVLQEFAFQDARARRLGPGITTNTLMEVMDFQVQFVRSAATGSPLPRPTDSVVKLIGMLEQKVKLPSVNSMSEFKPQILERMADVLKGLSGVALKEQEKLMKEHEYLVSFGTNYGSFDRAGKIAYIDAMEGVEERWRLMLKRLELTGELSQELVNETNKIIALLDIKDANDYRELLREARDIMRSDADVLD